MNNTPVDYCLDDKLIHHLITDLSDEILYRVECFKQHRETVAFTSGGKTV